jgi:N-acyl-D-amino-acid deacylase
VRRVALAALFCALPAFAQTYDTIIRGGLVYDGTGGKPVRADVGIRGDRVAAIGDLSGAKGSREIDARGMAVAPGFINMLSWATESLLVDGRAQSDIRQGVTLEIFGEGESMGPLNPRMKQLMKDEQGDLKFDVTWETLGEYLSGLEKRGVAVNVASFVGAATVRRYVLDSVNRAPNAEELARMQELVRQAMREGALGVGSSLIYAPGTYAKTDELIALCKAAAPFGGSYISHLRSEGDSFLPAVDEFLTIVKESGVHGEIYHLKAGGRDNWPKMAEVIAKIEKARAEGLDVTADMYLYTAGATGLDAAMPTWVQEGSYEEWAKRLKDPATKAMVVEQMKQKGKGWENLMLAAGPQGTLLLGFKSEKLKPLTGKTLAEVAAMRGKPAQETAIDLVVEDGSRVEVAYFLMSEDNIRRQIQLPWVSFGSDASAPSTEGAFLKSSAHPRTYGNVARLLGKYVREEKLITLEEAVRRLTSLSAANLRLKDRGQLKAGYFADVVVFDPATIQDKATFEKPHQYATGVKDVLVNGIAVLKNGEPTGEKAGRFVKGSGAVQ